MSDDDKKSDWKKGYDTVKTFLKNSKISTNGLDFTERAQNGKNLFFNNSKQTWEELHKTFHRMYKHHNSAFHGIKAHLRHRVYIYPTMKLRLFWYSTLTATLFMATKTSVSPLRLRVLGMCFLYTLLIPDFSQHRKRLSMELNRNLKDIFKFLE